MSNIWVHCWPVSAAAVILSARMLGKQAIELMPQFDMRGMMGG